MFIVCIVLQQYTLILDSIHLYLPVYIYLHLVLYTYTHYTHIHQQREYNIMFCVNAVLQKLIHFLLEFLLLVTNLLDIKC